MYKSEAHLQSLCTLWFDRAYQAQRFRLFLIYNNPPNARIGSMLKSMGLKKGITDQLYFTPSKLCDLGTLLWIEYKIDNRKQTDEQIEFQALVESYGFVYKVVRSESEFQTLIKSYNQ